MRLSAPPARTMSASPRAIRRNASPTAWVPAAQAVVIVLLGPWALKASEMWAATMFGRYLRIHSGNSASPPRWPSRSTLQLAVVVAGLDQRRRHLRQVDRHQAGAHDHADALGVLAAQVQAAVAHGQAGRGHARSAWPGP